MDKKKLSELARLVRRHIIVSTSAAGSGHPSSCLSSVELGVTLFFGGILRADLSRPDAVENDRVIFSKGHAAPLLYSLYAVAGAIEAEELLSLRKIGSRLEGHPTPNFPFSPIATGSLGQGLSAGIGLAINSKHIASLGNRVFVLLGDGEMAEGQIAEAMSLAAHYRLDNLIAIADVNGLGQNGETMYGKKTEFYARKAKACGWKTMVIDGHSISAVHSAYKKALISKGQPTMIIAKTAKGKGVKIMEGKNGWHGRALTPSEAELALKKLGKINLSLVGEVLKPTAKKNKNKIFSFGGSFPDWKKGDMVAVREAYGRALLKTGKKNPDIVVLDAETANSTFAKDFKTVCPKLFFEVFIAEQNMVSTAVGLSCAGRIPFVSTFAAFFTRAFDQIRMAAYSKSNIKLVGSHAGVSIGEDGVSQMGLEDIAMFRAIAGSVVLYPSDAVAMEKLVDAAAKHKGIVYLRSTRAKTPVIYEQKDEFHIGGSKVLRENEKDQITFVSAGITLFEALKAADELKKENIFVQVIDLYSVKPIDKETLSKAAKKTGMILTVEDHYPEGGILEAVRSALADSGAKIFGLCVNKIPISGKPQELLAYENLDSESIKKFARNMIFKN